MDRPDSFADRTTWITYVSVTSPLVTVRLRSFPFPLTPRKAWSNRTYTLRAVSSFVNSFPSRSIYLNVYFMDGSLEASEFSTGFMDRYVALVSAGIVTSPFSKAFSPEIPDTRTPLRKLCVSDTAVVSASVEATSEVYRSAFCPPCAFVFSSESICCVSASSAETVCCVAIAASLTVVAAAGTTQVFTATAQLSKSASHRFLISTFLLLIAACFCPCLDYARNLPVAF